MIDYSSILVKADGNPDIVKNNIIRSLGGDVLSVRTLKELEAANADRVNAMFNSISTYAYLAVLIGIFGIANNMAACFLSRQRNLAMYRCIGMTAKSAGRMLMTEAAAVGVIGAFAGLFTGILLMPIIPFMVANWGNVEVAVPHLRIAAICGGGIAIMLLCSTIPFAKGKNISIMDNIRYE
jgi:putative ABC transport system permease protein